MDGKFRFVDFEGQYPPALSREQVQKYFPWLSTKTLANLDSAGKGPRGAMLCGKVVVYPTSELLSWLDSRVAPIKKNKIEKAEPQETMSRAPKRTAGRKTKTEEVRERRGY